MYLVLQGPNGRKVITLNPTNPSQEQILGTAGVVPAQSETGTEDFVGIAVTAMYPELRPTPNVFGDVTFHELIDLQGDLAGYQVALNKDGVLLALRNRNERIYPIGGDLFILGEKWYTWENEVGQMVEVVVPEGYRGEIWNDPAEVTLKPGATGEKIDDYEPVKYLFALDENGNPVYRFDISTQRHPAVVDRWRELDFNSFVESRKPFFSATYYFPFKTSEGVVQIPLFVGLRGENFPVRSMIFKEPMIDILGKTWLTACWYRYTEHMNTDIDGKGVTFGEYVELVKKGGGQVIGIARDDWSARAKRVMVDPLKGASITITNEEDLPFKVLQGTTEDSTFLLEVNDAGMPKVVSESNSAFWKYVIKRAKTEGLPVGTIISFELGAGIMSALMIWAYPNWIDIIQRNGAGMDTSTTKFDWISELHNEIVDTAGINLRIEGDTPFIGDLIYDESLLNGGK